MRQLALFFFSTIVLFSCNNSTTKSSVKKDSVFTSSSIPTKQVIQNGESIERYANGVIKMQGMMKDGKRDGLWKSFYDNGSPWSETTFADGKKNGKTTTWYSNDQKRYEGFYTNDKEFGVWTFWNEKGKVTNIKNCNN